MVILRVFCPSHAHQKSKLLTICTRCPQMANETEQWICRGYTGAILHILNTDKPLTEEEIERNFTKFSARLSSHRVPQPAITDGRADAPDSENAGVSQPWASPPWPQKLTKDISCKIHGSRITKNTAWIQSAANHGSRSRQAAPTLAEAPSGGWAWQQYCRSPMTDAQKTTQGT